MTSDALAPSTSVSWNICLVGAQVRVAVVTASFKTPEARDTWVGHLKAAVQPSRDEAGTLSYQLSYGVQDPLKVVLIERCTAQGIPCFPARKL